MKTLYIYIYRHYTYKQHYMYVNICTHMHLHWKPLHPRCYGLATGLHLRENENIKTLRSEKNKNDEAWPSQYLKNICCSMSSTQLSFVFIHLAVCLITGPKPLPKRALHIVRSRASSFKWEYPLLSLRSSSSFLHLLPHLPVTSIPPFIFPSITHCRRQFLRKMRPIQLAFNFLISCRI